MRADKNDPQKDVFDETMADSHGLRRTDSGVSQSGYEHNNLFLGRGDQFIDVSGVSGFDHMADGRALSWTALGNSLLSTLVLRSGLVFLLACWFWNRRQLAEGGE